MAYINIDNLIDIDENLLFENSYILIMKPLVGDTKVSYKTDLNNLSVNFLRTQDLIDIESTVVSFREDLEKTIEKFEIEDFFKENNYITKEDADRERKKLLTYDNFTSLLGNYLTRDVLSVDLQESDKDIYNCVNSYVSTMLGASTTVKTSNSQITAMQDAIDSISLSGGE